MRTNVPSILVLTSDTHCSVSAAWRGSVGINFGPGKLRSRYVAIAFDFAEFEIAVAHHWNLAERVNGIDVR